MHRKVNATSGTKSRGRVQGVHTPPGFLIQLVFCKKTMWFIGVEVEQETSALPPKKILDPRLSRISSYRPLRNRAQGRR